MRIAIDIGGTFTDGVLEASPQGLIWVGKTLTTYADPGAAITTVIDDLLRQARASLPDMPEVAEVVHGTTLVTNTLIERKGVKTALVVTAGTRDVLDIGRELRYELYDLDIPMPEPLVEPAHRHEVDARMSVDGEEVRALDPQALDELAERLQRDGVSSVAVCLLHAFVNDAHERAVAEHLARRLPGVSVSISSRITREAREYERMSTAAASAYVQPLVEGYLRQLGERLRRQGITAPLRIMVSSGGFTSAAAAAEVPILLLESGPAGGVLSAVNTGLQAGARDILAFDMGGTTAKACVASGGRPSTAHMFEAARVHRFKRGSGLPLLIPSIDLIEIGAGGGSIAHVNELGLLAVGPASVGSEPGPACYGLGGTEPTVSDANLLLGYLNPDRFLGGEMKLSVEHAETALGALGKHLDMDARKTAWRIYDVVNENMASSARVHVAEKGHDPDRLTLVATGGAGPMHAVEVARKLGVKRVLVPIAAGAGSCLGFLAAPVRVERAYTKMSLLAEVDWLQLAAALERVKASAEQELASLGRRAEVQWSLSVEMRYAGQGFTLAVERPYGEASAEWAQDLLARFERRYVGIYGQGIPNGVAEVVTWRLVAASATESHRFHWGGGARAAGTGTAAPAEQGSRTAFVSTAQAFGRVPTYSRYGLAAGQSLSGPAIIEERETTIVVPVPARIRVLDDLTLSIELEDPS